MQGEWHVMPGSASAFWTEATFQFWMQMQIQERVGLLLVPDIMQSSIHEPQYGSQVASCEYISVSLAIHYKYLLSISYSL